MNSAEKQSPESIVHEYYFLWSASASIQHWCKNVNKMLCYCRENHAMLLQIFAHIKVYSSIAWFLYHSMAFLYRPTSATIQILKLHKVRRLSRSWREIMA